MQYLLSVIDGTPRSDRGIPRSFRMMDGFGVHTFRLVNKAGEGHFVKFHWRPTLGAHSLVWDEAQKLAGKDPDFHRRDLWEAIAAGAYPEYELALQIMPEADEHNYPFDILDATKIWPEELIPLRRVGKMMLNRNPENFFAETEQVAFHTANLVPGIEPSDDPLLQGRNFSYLDTQINRFNSTNFSEVPINRSIAPVHNFQNDGYMRQRIRSGRVAYFPSMLDDGELQLAAEDQGAFRHFPEPVEGQKVRTRSEKFKDYFSQPHLYWNSLSDFEQQHLVDAARFELGKVETMAIRERMVALFRLIDESFGRRVADGIGVSPPSGRVHIQDAAGRVLQRVSPPVRAGVWLERSPALSLANQPHEAIATRKIACLVADGVSARTVDTIRDALQKQGAVVETVGELLGAVKTSEGGSLHVDRSGSGVGSVMYDAVFVPTGDGLAQKLTASGDALHFINEAYKHGKPMGAVGEGVTLLERASIPHVTGQGSSRDRAVDEDVGIVTNDGSDLDAFTATFARTIAQHRFPLRPNLAATPA